MLTYITEGEFDGGYIIGVNCTCGYQARMGNMTVLLEEDVPRGVTEHDCPDDS